MLSIQKVKELLNNPNIPDKDAEKIRDDFRIFTEIIFEQWQAERNKGKKFNNKNYDEKRKEENIIQNN